MYKKYASVLVGTLLIITPLAVSAQTTSASSQNSLIAILTQLVQTLEKELQQLLSMRDTNTVNTKIATNVQNPSPSSETPQISLFSASPTYGSSGVVPMSFTFYSDSSYCSTMNCSAKYSIDFGDGSSSSPAPLFDGCNQTRVDGNCSIQIAVHTYSSDGTYTAKFENASGTVLATQTITVTGNNSTTSLTNVDCVDGYHAAGSPPQCVPSTAASSALYVSVSSGNAPLTVSFNPQGLIPADSYMIKFGDGQSSSQFTGSSVLSTTFNLTHTYTSAGTYTATIWDVSANAAGGTATIAVQSSAPSVSQSSATIDQGSLISSSANPTITGTVSGTSDIFVAIWRGNVTPPNPYSTAVEPIWAGNSGVLTNQVSVSISNGHWSATPFATVAGSGFSNELSAGIYTVAVYGGSSISTGLLASGTLTVQ